MDREPYDLIILEQAIRNLETFLLVAHPKTRHKIAFWGHGKNYTVARSGIEEKLKATLTNTGVWFFGYTQGGVDATVSSGYPGGQTTAVYNATDTSELRSQMASITEDELRQSGESLGLNGPTALYIGGLDEAKRIPFLLSAARMMHEKIPNFSLIIAGAGSSQSTVEDSADKFAYIKYVGNTFGREKAKLFQIADILMVPGRVGLVAVESAAAGVPIVTTKWPLHAPEFEYLTPQMDCLVSEDDVESYARTASDLLGDKQALSNLQDNCAELGKGLTIERMVEQFAHGVLSAVHMR
ncbi:glycosyltransferase involved in cell wall biosynthesis [Rhodococcus sp. SORGH_AS 301]|nr:glycosyltransferase involved in cell wall biosynthesis [Rhodococcus sp. SORGH_AS_0301]